MGSRRTSVTLVTAAVSISAAAAAAATLPRDSSTPPRPTVRACNPAGPRSVPPAVRPAVRPAVGPAAGPASSGTRTSTGTRTSGTSRAGNRVHRVAPHSRLNAMFASYAATGAGWTGGDSTYSVRLPDGRTLWVFSDTFLGPEGRGSSRPKTAPLVNNSFVVEDGGRLTTVVGGTATHPTSLVPGPDRRHWYWAGAAMVNGCSTLQVVYTKYHRTGPVSVEAVADVNMLATYRLDDLWHPHSITPLPSRAGIVWGVWLLPARQSGDAYTYIYGTRDLQATADGGKYAHVARVRGTDLTAPWTYADGHGHWSPREADSAPLLAGVSNVYSVTRYRGGYLLVTHDSRQPFGDAVYAYFARSPTGPFTHRTLLYRTPETGADGTYHDASVFTYNAHAQPELGSDSHVVISYDVNSLTGNDVYRDTSIYRPRFIDVHLR